MKSKVWILVAVLTVVCMVVTSCAPAATPTPTPIEVKATPVPPTPTSVPVEPITIGTLFPRSGAIAMLGEQAWRGGEIARKLVNEKGGVNGRPVLFADADGPDPEAATTEAERLISKENVPVIIGSLTSSNALAIAAVTERNGVILWETTGISDEITGKGYKFVLRTCDRGAARGASAVLVATESIAPLLGISEETLRIAMVHEDSSYGQSQVQGAVEEMEKRGLSFVMLEGYSKTATDLSGLVLRLGDAKPDVILTVGYINDAQILCNQLRQYSVIPKALVGGGAGYTDPQFAAGQGEYADGVMGIDMPSNLPLDRFRSADVRALVDEFRKRYMEEYEVTEVPLAAEVNFMGTYVLLNDVLPKAENMEPESIRKAAMAINIAETVLGWSVRFDETGQNLGAVPVAYQWAGGSKVIVWPEELADREMKDLPLRW